MARRAAWCGMAVGVLAGVSRGQTVWTEAFIEFEKPSGADWTLPVNQDRITDLVWITRKNFAGLFNIAQEDGYDDISPVGTEWAYGSAADWESLEFAAWVDWHGQCPKCAVGQPAVVHLMEEDIYIDIEMVSWDCCGAGGFAYTRASEPACAADVNGDGRLDVLDFVAFQQLFLAGDPAADCDGDGRLSVIDFVCYQQLYQAGCG